MYLKTLTVRGFKSFASATTFHFEPGVTAVVGPNGSGKSNVVDALAWVMGEQGAKNLRGGKMEDVIFAGTSGRAPLGRAQVSLTIDNADGALPIEYSEVTISRTLFRSGGSEYAINGNSCRLLDIQELLSDSGLGREMHVIVGQGQLDRILQASPEERRGFIEEASGVLKHRRRKERSVRKLESMRSNLDRVRDLAEEVRRQLGPLSRQATTARKAQRIQYDVRDARSRLLADELFRQQAELARLGAGDETLESALAAAEGEVARAEEAAQALAGEVATATQASAAARDHWYQLSTLAERYRSLAAVAAERERARRHPVPAPSGPDPQAARGLAERAAADAAEAGHAVEAAQGELSEASAARQQAERAARSAAETYTRLLQQAADRRQAAAVAAGRVEAARATEQSLRHQVDQGRSRLVEGESAAASLRADLVDHERRLAGSLDSEEQLDAAYEAAADRAETLRAELDRLEEALAAAESADGAAVARRDALAEALEPEAGAAVTVLGDLNPTTLAEAVQVDGGWEAAIAAALGGPAEQLVLEGLGEAIEAAGRLAQSGAADARLLYPLAEGTTAAGPAGAPATVPPQAAEPGRPDPHGHATEDDLPEGALDALSVLRFGADDAGETSETSEPDAPIARTVRALLAGTVLVADLEAATALLDAGLLPRRRHGAPLRLATRDGHVLGAGWTDGRGAGAGSRLERQAAADEAVRLAAETTHEVERLRFQRAGLQRRVEAAGAEESAALDALNASDARFTAVTEELARLNQQLSHAGDAVQRQRAELAALRGRLDEATAAVGAAEERARQASGELHGGGTPHDPADSPQAPGGAPERQATDPDPAARDEAEREAGQSRHRETEARLALRAAESTRSQADARAEQSRRQVSASTLAHQERDRAERQRRAWLQRISAVACALDQALGRVEGALARADGDRTALDRRGEELAAERGRLQRAAEHHRSAVAAAKDRLHAARMARQEQQLRLDQLTDKALDQLGMTADYLLEHFGPEVPVPLAPPAEAAPVAAAPGSGPDDGPGAGTDAGPGAGTSPDPGTGPGADDALEHEPETVPFDRAEQQKRLRRAERELAALGRVNPLALEEYAAVEERHRFLQGQLEDLDASRRDLLTIIQDVDDTVLRVFSSAFEDTAAQFQHVFATLFPGGEGRLFLTDPDNLLESGVEVEARPAGKKVKRLSLLSGGERSLAAVAMLVAIFKARPSPFYVMDEVEAALDDTNLGRLLEIFRELQQDSQLIIITHQKRTMEVADALYGVSMRGDGVSAVISQRLDAAPAGPADPVAPGE
jgi:chromosome segregation protein